MNGQNLSEIRRVAEEVTSREGCYLYDVEFIGGGQGRVLRVTIDKDVEGGVSVEDCTNVSRALNLILDPEDGHEDGQSLIPGGNYNLEVSSPGLERPLRIPQHFERAISKKVLIRTFQPLAQFNESLAQELGITKQVQGALRSVDASGVRVELLVQNAAEERALEVFVPMESVTKAHIVFDFVDPSEKKNSPKKGKSKK